MNWSIKTISHCCALTGNSFNEGDEVVCLICRPPEGELTRFDVLRDQIDNFSVSGEIIGQWKRIITLEKNLKINLQQQLANQEEFFFSLFNGEKSREKEVLKQLLALLLEKKRIIRPMGESLDGIQNYIHIRTKETFKISVSDILPEELTSIENVFEMLAQ